MPEPIYSDFTEELYSRLPLVHRDEDAKGEFTQWVFKGWLSGMGDVAGAIDALVDDIEYLGYWEEDADPDDTSFLADARYAREEWLPWIAMTRGIFIPPRLTEEQRRSMLYSYQYDAGTKQSIINYLQFLLTGTKFCKVYDHTSDTSGLGLGGRWDVLVVTRASETSFDVVAAVVAANLKPAGVKLQHKSVSTATWDLIESTYPFWDDWDAAGSWDALLAGPDEEEE